MARPKKILFSIHNLRLSYDGREILALDKLKINRGEHLLLLGPSGSGKSSLLYLLAGLLPLQQGSIQFETQNYGDLSMRQMDRLRAEKFGFIFQKHHLLPHLSVAQNIGLAGAGRSQIEGEILLRLGLYDKKKQLAQTLSVGEAQRVAIARAVANRPAVIFADEPTAALDDENAKSVMALLMEQAEREGATLIVATHDARIKPFFNYIHDLSPKKQASKARKGSKNA